MSNRQQHRRCWPGRQGRPRVRDSRYYETAGGNKVRPKKIFLFHLLTTTPKPTEQRHATRRGVPPPPRIVFAISTQRGGYAPPLCCGHLNTARRVCPSACRCHLATTGRGASPPRLCSYHFHTQQGGLAPSSFAFLPCPHSKEGSTPSPFTWRHSCQFHATKRVLNTLPIRVLVICTQRRGFNTLSVLRFFHFRATGRVLNPPCSRSLISEQRGGYRAPPVRVSLILRE